MKTPIPSAGEAVPKPVTSSDLETPLMNALRMASIACGVVERAIGGKPYETHGSLMLFGLSKDQREDAMFAVIQTETFIEELKNVWSKIDA
jgi:hypothetical protein